MLHDAAAVRAAFDHLGEQYIELTRSLDDADLAKPGLGQWTLRDLIAHAVRAFSTAAANLDATRSIEFTIHTAGEYFRTTFASSPNIHAEIAERGVRAGNELGADAAAVAATVERIITQACARVGDADDNSIVNHLVGQVPFVPYLATRVVEAGVHLLDVQRALGRPAELDRTTADIVLLTLAETGDVNQIILSITGRARLPPDYNVLR